MLQNTGKGDLQRPCSFIEGKGGYMKKILAFDLGSSSGRAVRGIYDKGKLTCEEVCRFANTPVQAGGRLCWDFPRLLDEVRRGIELAGETDSIGFDAWGADFGLLGEDGELLGLPVHYRDPRTEGMIRRVTEQIPAMRLFELTGNQIYATNTLYQILACKTRTPDTWGKARKLLHIPDLFTYCLTGNMVCERTIASTTQMLDPSGEMWSREVLEKFGVPSGIFAPLTDSGTIVGTYRGAKVAAVAGHDTQSAGAALTSARPDAAFLNIGTWSLMGIDREQPILSREGYRLGVSNEQSAYGGAQCIMNMGGLWLLQEAKRAWEKEGESCTFDGLERLAEAEQPNRYLLDPGAADFALPGDMPGKIRAFCERTGQGRPETRGEIVRCIYDSLSWTYRWNLERLEQAVGHRIEELHILGGGAKSPLLCRLTADRCMRPVKAGPVEATALGNILLQLRALGEVKDRETGRRIVRDSEPVHLYEPGAGMEPADTFARYLRIVCGK